MVSLRLGNCSPALRACWHPVASVGEVAEQPHSVRLLGQPYVIARVGDRLTGFADKCPHRGAPLSAGCVASGTLRCAYHGWAFGADGACVDIPAVGPDASIPPRAALTPVRVVEHAGLVWMALDEPTVPIPTLAPGEDDEPASYLVTEWDASAAHMMDNFIDVGHFAFSHAGSFGVADDARSVDVAVERQGWTVVQTHRHQARLVDSVEWAEGRAPGQWRTQTYRYHAPFTLELGFVYDDQPDVVQLTFAVQPVDERRSRLFSSVRRNQAAASRCTPDEGYERAMLIIDEDRTLLESVDEDHMSLEPTSQIHTRADRGTVALRRVLADLVAVGSHDLPTHPHTTPE